MGFFSPLNSMIENSESSPHAATIKSSVRTKFNDTFNFWAGSIVETPHYSYNPTPSFFEQPVTRKNVGVFDYLTFGTALLGLRFFEYSYELASKHWLGSIPLAAAIIINAPLILARFIFGIAMTILSSPVVLTVHAIASVYAYKDFQNMLALQGQVIENTTNRQINPSITLDDFLKGINNPHIEDLTAHSFVNNQNRFCLKISQEGAPYTFYTEVSPSDAEQVARLESFLKFNIYANTDKLEYQPEMVEKFIPAATSIAPGGSQQFSLR
ncbi:hypothetical protein [Legionella septentrionalis]|uniref:hypothetical protein n=2 Tax=Legionellaceae TaxID=444 RepID=UPI000F8E88D3|nr:hypothetical protein [Legionella septentrionalis]RUR11848.1 hypothetical protein ELY14_00980 [Legionella septentrionalis]RUR17535.1 hypothetical protein ELY10_00975 [Legionella septentrionalis]